VGVVIWISCARSQLAQLWKGQRAELSRLVEWLGNRRASCETWARVCVSASRSTIPVWGTLPGTTRQRLQQGLAQAESWVAHPPHLSAGEQGDRLRELASERGRLERGSIADSVVGAVVWALATANGYLRLSGFACHRTSEHNKALRCIRGVRQLPNGEERAYPGVTQEVVPWALGYSDPIRMRVAKAGEVEITPNDL
jgi:hypothetical protein